MVNSIIRDQKRRKLFLKNEQKRVEYKSFLKNSSISQFEKREFLKKLNKLSRNSSKVRIRNRCILTGRGRGVYSKYRLSRIRFRELASQGLIPGVIKANW
jgi:small subunit ribosomal protein S14